MKILIPLVITILLITISFLLFSELENSTVELLNQVKDNPLQYSIFSFLAIVADIFLPIPSSIVLYLNGVFLGFVKGFLVSMISVIGFSIVGYSVGKYSSKVLKSKVDTNSERLLKDYGHLAIIITRGIPIMSESICIVCGYNLYDFKTYMIFNLIGCIPICFIYAYFGSIAVDKNLFLFSFGISLVFSFLLWLFGKRLVDKLNQKNKTQKNFL